MEGASPIRFDELGDDLPPELRGRIKGELEPGERLIWAGRGGRPVRPTPHVYSQPQLPPVLLAAGAVGLLGLAAAGVAVLAGAFGSGVEDATDRRALLILSGLFAVLGAASLAGAVKTWAERLRKRGVEGGRLYAITDRRVIAWEPTWDATGLGIYSFPIDKLGKVHRVEYPDGLGDVLYSVKYVEDETYGLPAQPGLYRIAGPKRVEDLPRRSVEARRDEVT